MPVFNLFKQPLIRNRKSTSPRYGHIGLLGHGEGIKYRNIRVKEL